MNLLLEVEELVVNELNIMLFSTIHLRVRQRNPKGLESRYKIALIVQKTSTMLKKKKKMMK